MFNLPSYVKEILRTLTENGYEAYVVGGAVRDFVMGKIPQDFDVTTSACPEEICSMFAGRKLVEIGKKHGTVGVVCGDTVVEITTYRSDTDYTDHRRPGEIKFCATLKEDVIRRDFTVNALAFDGDKIIDLCGGLDDIKNGVIRAVGDPDKRFKEDALRMMRALRFSSVLGFTIDKETESAIYRNMELLRLISKERITTELMKLLCGCDVERIITEYSKVLDVFLPGVERMHGFEHFSMYHIYDVLVHTAKTVALCPKIPIIRLAALLHDVGKPVCYTQEDCGIRHFKGHPKVSLEITKDAIKNLSLSIEERELLLFLVEFHDERIESTKEQVKIWMNKYSKEYFNALLHIKKADAETHSNYNSMQRDSAYKLRQIYDDVTAKNEPYNLSMLAVNGNDIIEAGCEKGSRVGGILDSLMLRVIAQEIANDKNTLIDFAKRELI